jgi:hypothetical protein
LYTYIYMRHIYCIYTYTNHGTTRSGCLNFSSFCESVNTSEALVYTHTHTHTHTHNMYVCMYVCMYIYMYMYMYICIHVYMYMYMYTCIHIYIYEYLSIQARLPRLVLLYRGGAVRDGPRAATLYRSCFFRDTGRGSRWPRQARASIAKHRQLELRLLLHTHTYELELRLGHTDMHVP